MNAPMKTPERKVTSRVIRRGEPEPAVEPVWLTPEDRIAAVWDLTLLCLAWRGDEAGEPRFRDLLAAFNAHRVEFLLVGAHALAAHGLVRATNDLDLWLRANPENAERTLRALSEFGAPLHDLTVQDLVTPGLIFLIGVPPIRIDLLTAIVGVEFQEAWQERLPRKFADQPVGVISRRHLIINKRASGRSQDLADLEWLERAGGPQ